SFVLLYHRLEKLLINWKTYPKLILSRPLTKRLHYNVSNISFEFPDGYSVNLKPDYTPIPNP
ncbi:MAG: hypothetical protein NE328_23740, partial [Lentisphaeraceae bacterium]|nr:hypothetical protein [Lentisphaeraceae bacterium]